VRDWVVRVPFEGMSRRSDRSGSDDANSGGSRSMSDRPVSAGHPLDKASARQARSPGREPCVRASGSSDATSSASSAAERNDIARVPVRASSRGTDDSPSRRNGSGTSAG
jgi:hypothetical protein